MMQAAGAELIQPVGIRGMADSALEGRPFVWGHQEGGIPLMSARGRDEAFASI